jgi:2-polyprenyl-3-methyl-5-hydroxy-6-metoxy-1,4-benzoquinol methylase
MPMNPDRSSGYEAVASEFSERRRAWPIGLGTIRNWAKQVPAGASVLDLGCGTGIPVATELARLGFSVAGIDASPTLIAEFRRQIPAALWACEAVEDSSLFGRKFDAVLAIGFMFLLPEDVQQTVIAKVGEALESDGRFLFTAPHQRCEWADVLTGKKSVSLGENQYTTALLRACLAVTESYVDEGENFYFACRKTGSPARPNKSLERTRER